MRGAFGKVLAYQAIHILVGAMLPRAVWVTEVHRHARVGGQLLVQRHLLALVVRHALPHGLCNSKQLFCKGLHDMGSTGGLELRQLYQHKQAAGALDQGAHSSCIASTLDELLQRSQTLCYCTNLRVWPDRCSRTDLQRRRKDAFFDACVKSRATDAQDVDNLGNSDQAVIW